MLPTVINGLPAHVLLVHVVVALVPLGALFTILCAVWPAARRRLGVISPITCLVALVFVPITTHAGEWFRNRIDPQHRNAALTKHADLGGTLLWYAIGLTLVSVAVWVLGRRSDRAVIAARTPDVAAVAAGTGGGGEGGTATAIRTQPRAAIGTLPRWASVAVAVVAVAVSVLVVWQCYRVGDSGAHAVWNGTLAS